jgi:hypothetical protein
VGRRRDPRHRGQFAFHHGDAAGMTGAIMREAAGQISRLVEIIDKRVEHLVERILAVSPVAQEV